MIDAPSVLTAERRAEIEKLLAAITAGRWMRFPRNQWGADVCVHPDEGGNTEAGRLLGSVSLVRPCGDANATFWAEAPSIIRDLLHALDAKTQECEQLKAVVDATAVYVRETRAAAERYEQLVLAALPSSGPTPPNSQSEKPCYLNRAETWCFEHSCYPSTCKKLPVSTPPNG
jgi:hypothetical protein